jgi:hypothetical protein
MSRLMGALVLGLVATLGCQKPENADTKPDPVVAASAEPAKAAPLAAGQEPGCCDPSKGEPSCDNAAGGPSGDCGCRKAPSGDCPHRTAPANRGTTPCPCKDNAHEGCPHAAGAKDGTPCPCKGTGHEGCPHAGS